MEKNKKLIVIGGAVGVGLIVLFNSLTVVPTGYAGIKTNFGKVQKETIQEGLNIKAPFVEKIVKIDCRTKKLEVDGSGSTRDMQDVNVKIAVNYNVEKKIASKLYKNVGIDYENIIIQPAMQEAIKSNLAKYTAEELISKRSEVSDKIQEDLTNKISSNGFEITDFNVLNIDFSEAYDEAIEKKAVKQQEVATAQAELEKTKIENEKEIEQAKKDAEVMRLQNQEITDKTLQLKELEIKQKAIDKWNGQLPTTSLGENVPFINVK